MPKQKLAKYDKKHADLLFYIGVLIAVAAISVSALRSDLIGVVVCSVIISGLVLARVLKWPMTGPVVIEISDSGIFFNDAALGGALFKLEDIEEVRIVGPKRSRRIRIVSKDGNTRDVYCDPWGNRFQRAVAFLADGLPKEFKLIEEEPPTWAEALRGDY